MWGESTVLDAGSIGKTAPYGMDSLVPGLALKCHSLTPLQLCEMGLHVLDQADQGELASRVPVLLPIAFYGFGQIAGGRAQPI